MAYTPKKKERQKQYNKTYTEKISNDPTLKAKYTEMRKKIKEKHKANMTPEQKERERKYQREYKRAQRTQKKQGNGNPEQNKVNVTPSKVTQIKQLQMKVACEQAEEL